MAEIPAYILVTRRVVNAALAREYLAGAAPVAESYGGRYLVRGADGDVREGEPFDDGVGVALIFFPSLPRAREFYDSHEYAPWRELASRAFDRRLVILEGLPA